MRIFASVLLLFMSLSASAIPVQWTLNNVVLGDGTSVTGSFVFDADAPANQSFYEYGDSGAEIYYAQGYQSFDIAFGEENWDVDPFTSTRDAINVKYEDWYSGAPGPHFLSSDASNLKVVCDSGYCSGGEYETSLVFEFITPLSNAGGVVAITGGYFFADAPANYSEFDFTTSVVGGSVVASVVPIPAAAWLFGSALLALGWLRKRVGV